MIRRFLVMFLPNQIGVPRLFLIETGDGQEQKKLESLSGRYNDLNVNDVTISGAIFKFEEEYWNKELTDSNLIKLDGEFTIIKTGYRRS